MSWEGDNNERVLVPVGNDACSKDALRWAVANKISHPDDLLVLLHIVTKAPGPDGYDVAQSAVSKTAIVQHVRTAIMPMLSQLKAGIDAKVRLELRVGRNDSRDAGIMEEAKKLQATCLVLGTKNRGMFTIYGSRDAGIMEEAKKLHATCLVLGTKGRGMFTICGKLSGSTSAFCLKSRSPALSLTISPLPSSSHFLSPLPSSSHFLSPLPSSSHFLSPLPSSSHFLSPLPSSSHFLSPLPSSSHFLSPLPSSSPFLSPLPSSSPFLSPRLSPPPRRGKLSGSTSAYCVKNRPPSLSVIVVSKDKVLLVKQGDATPPDRSPALSLTGSPLPGASSPAIPSAGSSPGESRRNSESRSGEGRSDAVQVAQESDGGGKVSGSGSGSGSFGKGSFVRAGSTLSDRSAVSDGSSSKETGEESGSQQTGEERGGDSSKLSADALTVADAAASGEERGSGDGQEGRGKRTGEERGVDRELQQLREQQQQRLMQHQQQQLQAATKLAALMEGVSVGGGAGGGGGGWGGNGFGGVGRGEGGGVRGGGAGGEGAGGDNTGGSGAWSDDHDSASAVHAVARSQQRMGMAHESTGMGNAASAAGTGFQPASSGASGGSSGASGSGGSSGISGVNGSGGSGNSGGFSLASSTGSTFTMGSRSGASSRAGSGGEPTTSPITAGTGTGSGSGNGGGMGGGGGKEAGMVAAASAVAGVKEAGGVGESGGAAAAAGGEVLKASSGVYCRVYSYEEIQRATDNFCPQLVLGEGGCGTVFSGMLGGSKVAVKVIKTEDATRAAKEFQREVELLSQINHPHVLSLLGCCPSHHCIVYEFMASGTLEERLLCANNSPPLPWFARLRIAAEIASALLALHSQPKPIIHLDLKPANVLLDERLVVKLADVGVARQMPGTGGSDQGFNVTHAHTSMPIGTVAYVDPEYQRTGDFSPKSDVYALGIILFDLLTGRQPALYERIEDAVDEGNEVALGKLLDGKAGKWPVGLAMEVARVAVRCSEMKRKKRPDLGEVVMPVLMKAQKEAVILMERMMAGM
ncbi:unnamed protein product [Closterium sp. Naga37s-1]|nr:unnamed protein product [Closterium sp. Naga37s-1]CAI5506177.1 unnamed protein product [Closterium sp. Naga37s-1]